MPQPSRFAEKPGRQAPRHRADGRGTVSECMLKALQALIWMLALASAGPAWATGAPAGDPERPLVISPGPPPAPASQGPAAGARAQERPETDADRLFRVYMLPGVAVLVLIVAGALAALFFPNLKRA